MNSRLARYSLFEQNRLKGLLRPVIARYGGLKASYDSIRQAITVLEDATASHPRTWVYWYVLADCYNCIGRLVDSVRACEKCYALRPQDPRSAYALATSLRVLLRARYVGDPRVQTLRERLSSGPPEFEDFNPEASQAALLELGLTLDTAAERVLFLFEKLLQKVKGADADEIEENLAAVYADFPHLESKVMQACYGPNHWIFKTAGGLFTQARRRCRRLKYVGGHRTVFRLELLTIIHLCQMAVAADPNYGPPFVLLALTYLQAAKEALSISRSAHVYFLSRARALIGHLISCKSWMNTTLVTVGYGVLADIDNEAQRVYLQEWPVWRNQVISMQTELLLDALDPRSLAMRQSNLGLAET